MLIADVKKLSPLDRFCYWVSERHKVALRRKTGHERPWTDDEILQSNRFCNIRRMDDKVSVWLYDNWYKPHFDHPNMLRAVGLARFVNRPQSLEAVGFPTVWNAKRIKTILRALKRKGPIFNAAYMVRGNDGMDKVASVVDYYVVKGLSKVEVDSSSMEATHKSISKGYGLGSFMAGQIVADLRWAMSGTWADKMTWVPMGPGSKRGLNRLLERPIAAPLRQGDFLVELQRIIQVVQQGLDPSVWSSLEAHDYQNCLCEYDKHERILWGQGRAKQRYPGN